MKVKLIRNASIEEFILQNARSKSSMDIFRQVLRAADWNNPVDIKNTFARKADIICNGTRIVFDVGGRVYRIICGMKFMKTVVYLYIKFIGTHAEYDKLCNVSKKETGICEVDLYK